MSSMHRCQYCGSHVFQSPNDFGWHDLLKDLKCSMRDDLNHEPYQHAAFYVFDVGSNAEKIYESDDMMIARIGQLRIWDSRTQQAFRTTNQIVQVGFFNDELLKKGLDNKFIQFLDEPHFEVIDNKTQQITRKTTFDEALKLLLGINTPKDV